MAVYPTKTGKEVVCSPAAQKQGETSNKGKHSSRGYKRSDRNKSSGEAKIGANLNASESPTETPSEQSIASKPTPTQIPPKEEAPTVEVPVSGDKAQTATAFEVGWMFVQQYYTFLNKSPKRLHCFYKAKSAMIIGKECGEMKTYYGQKGAHERVLELKYNNCKVVISNVDVQASSYGSIVIQVLGELSSDNEPAQRFAQTFVLCEQERGFFILNDIFRFLKDTKSDAQGVGFVGVVIEDGEFKVVNLSEKEPAQFNGSAPKSSSDVSEVTSLKVEPSTPVGETPIEPIVASNREVASTIPDQISEAIPTQDSVLENPLKTTTTASSKKLEGEASSLSTECRPIEADAIKNDKIESKPVGSKFTRSTNSQIKANSALKSSWANLAAGRLNNADAAEANLSQSQDVSPKEVQQSSSTGLRQKTKAPRETYKGYNYTNSVCIRGLKEPISKEPVMEVFSKFGTIKNLDVSNHLVFIEYEEQEGCAKALANPDTAVGEEKILVEARRPKNNSRNPGNRRGNGSRKGLGSRAQTAGASESGNWNGFRRSRQGGSRTSVAPTN